MIVYMLPSPWGLGVGTQSNSVPILLGPTRWVCKNDRIQNCWAKYWHTRFSPIGWGGPKRDHLQQSRKKFSRRTDSRGEANVANEGEFPKDKLSIPIFPFPIINYLLILFEEFGDMKAIECLWVEAQTVVARHRRGACWLLFWGQWRSLVWFLVLLPLSNRRLSPFWVLGSLGLVNTSPSWLQLFDVFFHGRKLHWQPRRQGSGGLF